MRITNQLIVDNALRRLRDVHTANNDARDAAITGRRVNLPSDDPTGAGRILALRAAERARVQEQRNADDAEALLNAADTNLRTITSRLQRVRDLVVQGANTTTISDGGGAIADEIASIRDELVALANARHAGRPLFSGFADVDAVARDGGGTFVYQGDAGEVRRRIGDIETVTVNVRANDVFGFTAGDDLFTRLDTIESQLRSGDVNGLQASLNSLDGQISRVTEHLGVVGAATNRVESARNRSVEGQMHIGAELSELEHVDMAEAIMELRMQEVALQATQQALGRAFPPSLASFLQ